MSDVFKSLLDEAKGDYDPAFLSETGSGGFLSNGYLDTAPAASYLNDGEVPHYVLATADSVPSVDIQDSEAPPDIGSYRALGIVTDSRVLILVGQEGGDYEKSLPLWNITDVETTGPSGFFTKTATLTITTVDDGTVELTDTEGIDISAVSEYLETTATARKIEYVDQMLVDIVESAKIGDFDQARAEIGDARSILDPALWWSDDSPVSKHNQGIDHSSATQHHDRLVAAEEVVDSLATIEDEIATADGEFREGDFQAACDTYERLSDSLESVLATATTANLAFADIVEAKIDTVQRRITENEATVEHGKLHEEAAKFWDGDPEYAGIPSDRPQAIRNALDAAEAYLDCLTHANFDTVDDSTDSCAVCGRSPGVTYETTIGQDTVRACAACVALTDDGPLPRSASVHSSIQVLKPKLGRKLYETGAISRTDDDSTWSGISDGKLDKPELIAAIYVLANELQRPPAYDEAQRQLPGSPQRLSPYYETLAEFDIGFEDALLRDIKRVVTDTELQPRTHTIAEKSQYPQNAFETVFESLDQARKQAGVRPVAEYSWVGQFRDFYREHNRAPGPDDIADLSRIKISEVLSDANNWADALAAAGLPETDESIEQYLKQTIAEIANALGHRPSKKELVFYSPYTRWKLRELLPSDTSLEATIEQAAPFDERTLLPRGPLDEAPDESTAIPSHTDLLRELLWLVRRHGRQTTQDDLGSLSTYEEEHFEIQFGSVTQALDTLESAPDDTRATSDSYAPKSLLSGELKELGEYLGRGPSVIELLLLTDVPPEKYASKFGSLDEIHEAAGFERHVEQPTTDQLVEDLQRLETTRQHPPRLETYVTDGQFDYAHLVRRFDDWFGALRGAGFDPLDPENPILDYHSTEVDMLRFEARLRIETGLGARTVLIDELHRLAYELDAAPSPDAVAMLSQYPENAFEECFGSVQAGIAAAGLDDEPTVAPATLADIEETLLTDVRELVETTETPPLAHLLSARLKYSPTTIIAVFGSLENIADAVDHPFDDGPEATTAELKYAFERAREAIDGEPRPHDIGRHSPFSGATFMEVFGSSGDLYEAVQSEPVRTVDEQDTNVSTESADSPTDQSDELPDAQGEGAKDSGSGPAAVDADSTDLDHTSPPTRANLRRQLEQLATELERPLKSNDLSKETPYSNKDYCTEFGSFDDALAAAGIDRRDQVVDELARATEQLGRLPNQADVDEICPVSGPFIVRHFDDWKGSLRAYLEREDYTGENAPEDLLLGEIERLGRRQPDVITEEDLEQDSVFNLNTYIEKFGTWVDVLEAAGVDVAYELLDSMRRASRRQDGPLSADTLKKSDQLDVSLFVTLFGSPNGAVEVFKTWVGRDEPPAATTGAANTATCRRASMVAAVRRAHEREDDPLTPGQFAAHSDFQSNEFNQHFDNWSELLQLAGLDPREQMYRELDRVVANHGDIPDKEGFLQESGLHPEAFKYEFNRWSGFLGAYSQWDRDNDGVLTTGEDSRHTQIDTEEVGSPEANKPQTLIEAIRRAGADVDRPLHPSDVESYSDFGQNQWRGEHDFWSEAVSAAGIDHEQRMMREFDRVVKELGKIPSKREMSIHTEVSSNIYARFYDSWSAAKERYREWCPNSDGHDKKKSSIGQQSDPGEQAGATDEGSSPAQTELLEALQTLCSQTQHPVTGAEIDAQLPYETHQYTSEFGSLSAAFEAAGIDRSDEMFYEFHRVAEELDHIPSTTEFGDQATVSHSLVSDIIGLTWTEIKSTYPEWARENGIIPVGEETDEDREQGNKKSNSNTGDPTDEDLEELKSNLDQHLEEFLD